MPHSEPKVSVCSRLKRWPWAVIRIVCLALLLLLLICMCIIMESLRLRHAKKHSRTDMDYHHNLVHQVNAAGTTWKAQYNKFGSRATENSAPETPVESLKRNLILLQRNLQTETKTHLEGLLSTHLDLPHSFDARLEWPLCWSVHSVPNQGGCGSCWAMSATAAMSDRVCIHSNGTDQPHISAEDLTGCCKLCGGCRGAVTGLAAFDYWHRDGLVTGGSYGSYQGCKPYSIPSDCGQPCPLAHYEKTTTPSCTETCSNLYSADYEEDKYYASNAYALTVEELVNSIRHAVPDLFSKSDFRSAPANLTTVIKMDLKLHGPLLGCFSVFEDFQHYKSGVYTHIAGEELYGHCAKIIGWGVENGTNYWIFTNTWGRTWGENGHFRLSEDFPLEEVIGGIPSIRSPNFVNVLSV